MRNFAWWYNNHSGFYEFGGNIEALDSDDAKTKAASLASFTDVKITDHKNDDPNIEAEYFFCPYCGDETPHKRMNCLHCGQNYSPDFSKTTNGMGTCSVCGYAGIVFTEGKDELCPCCNGRNTFFPSVTKKNPGSIYKGFQKIARKTSSELIEIASEIYYFFPEKMKSFQTTKEKALEEIGVFNIGAITSDGKIYAMIEIYHTVPGGVKHAKNLKLIF